MAIYKVYEYTKSEMLDIYEKESAKGKTMFGICKQLGINEQTLRDLLRKSNFTYNRKKKRYIRDITPKKIDKPKVDFDDAYKEKHLGEVTNKDLLNQIKAVSEELKNINQRIDKGIVRETLNKDIITGGEMEIKNIKQTSIKVDEETVNRFNKLCKDYQHINKSYMLSLAIKEFCDKYEK